MRNGGGTPTPVTNQVSNPQTNPPPNSEDIRILELCMYFQCVPFEGYRPSFKNEQLLIFLTCARCRVGKK